MCGPMAAMVGPAVSAAGSIAGGMAQAAVADYNAKVAKINAQAALREGFYNAGTTRDQYQEVAGAQRAALANAGVVIDAGSAAVLATENQRREEVAASLDIWRGRTQAVAYNNQANQFKAEGSAAKTAGFIGAASSLVGGIAKMPGVQGFTGAGLLGPASSPVVGTSSGLTAVAPLLLKPNPNGLPLGRV